METPHFPGQSETGVDASRSLQVIVGKLLVVGSEPLSYDTRKRPVKGMRRALLSEKNVENQGATVIIAEYKEDDVAQIADLISSETRAMGPFTGHVEFDIRNSTTAATGIVYTRQDASPVVLFNRLLDPSDPHSRDSRQSFEFTRKVGAGLLWADLLYDERPFAAIEQEADVDLLTGLGRFLSSYLPAEAS